MPMWPTSPRVLANNTFHKRELKCRTGSTSPAQKRAKREIEDAGGVCVTAQFH